MRTDRGADLALVLLASQSTAMLHHPRTFSRHSARVSFSEFYARPFYENELYFGSPCDDAQSPMLHHRTSLEHQDQRNIIFTSPSAAARNSQQSRVQSCHLSASQPCHTWIRNSTIRCYVKDIPILLRATESCRCTTNKHRIIRTSSH